MMQTKRNIVPYGHGKNLGMEGGGGGGSSCQSERSGGIVFKGIVKGIVVIKFRNTKNSIGSIHFSRKLNNSKTLCSP